MYVRSSLHASVLKSVSLPKQFELLAIDLEFGKDCHLCLVGCYRPPAAVGGALASLSSALTDLLSNDIVLLGDLNWDWMSPNSDQFKAFCDSVNLTQLIDSPTRLNHKNPSKSTLLDIILTNKPHKYTYAGVFPDDISDHCAIAAIRNCKIPKAKPRIITKRNFKQFDIQGYLHDVFLVDWDRFLLIPDVATAWQYFHTLFMKIVNKHAPIKRFRVKGRDNPWFSNELSELIHERNLAWATARKSDSERDWLAFRALRNKCTAFIRSAKSEYYLNETSQNINNPVKFWKTIKSLSPLTSCNDFPDHILLNDQRITNMLDITNCFNKHFISSGSIFKESSVSDAINPSPPLRRNGPSFSFSAITRNEVLKALKNLDSKKSAGPDEIEPYFLKLAAEIIAGPLSYIFNLSLEQNIVPDVWKSALVVPLLKGGDPTILDNYRPISKLSIIAKVLETILSEQLKDFLVRKSVLSKFQSGFRKNHSTATATMKVLNDVTCALDRGKSCAAVFIDLTKAFDTVNHSILLSRLCSIGLSDFTLGWVSNYLNGRTQRVQIKGSLSDKLNIDTGVPQGSILGPLLFTLYINNLGDDLSDADIHLYADDTVIYCSAPSMDECILKLQEAFERVQLSLLSLKLVLNDKKTKYMIFSRNRRSIPSIPPLFTLQGTAIELVSSYKYLGFVLEEDLSFKLHVKQLLSKLRLKLGFYYRNSACFSQSARRKLVEATFLPVLDYGDIFYRNTTKVLLQSLDSTYHSALRFITRKKHSTHHCVLYDQVGWPSLYIRRHKHWLLFVYKAIVGQGGVLRSSLNKSGLSWEILDC